MKIAQYLVLACSISAFCCSPARSSDAAEAMSVQVKATPLRDAPSFLGKAVANLAYGDRVQSLATQGAWTQVRTPSSATGWVHTSALTPKRIVLKSGSETAQTRASGDELALAGKGFNSDVESEFKRQHREIDFSVIDRMEKIRISPEKMQAFLKAGAVMPAEGGAK